MDGTPITFKEYQAALSRQVEFYNQMMGGKGLTQKQLEEMGIKQSVLNGLIQQKLILNAATDMGFVVSLEEVKNEIRNMPYFKTNEKFDVNLYRNMLQSNGYIPQQFEELVINDLKQKKVDELFNNMVLSDAIVKDILKFKNNISLVEGIKVSRQSLSPLISVSEQEIKDYLAKPENQKALEGAYTDNFAKYNKAEEVHARHILIKGDDQKALEKIKAIKARVSAKNFSEVAKKETEDPTGKNNGGDLKWFARGQMVPEFEEVAFKMNKGEVSEPVKTQFGYHLILVEDKKAAEVKPLESVKKELAQLQIQKTKAQDLDQLMKTEEEKLMAALNKNDISALEGFAKKVDGQLLKNAEVNQFDQMINGSSLAPQEAEKIFAAAPGTTVNLGNAGTIYLVKIISKRTAEDVNADKLKAEITSQSMAFSRKVREEIIRVMNNKAKVVTNTGLL